MPMTFGFGAVPCAGVESVDSGPAPAMKMPQPFLKLLSKAIASAFVPEVIVPVV